MNHKIANILKGYIGDLTWIDKISGLVQTANIRIKNGDNISEKSYPISCDIDYDACLKGGYQDLTPNSKKKSVLYFEDKGVSDAERVGNRLKLQSSLRLVCWLNLREINGASCNSGAGSCGVSGDYVIEVIKALPNAPFSTADFVSIYLRSISQVERSVDIFSKYTYNEEATQYLMYPYDYFALDLVIDFTIPCIEPQYVPPPVYNDYFLPSRDALREMRTELFLHSVGGFDEDAFYWSSSEVNQFQGYTLKMSIVAYEVPPNLDPIIKQNGLTARACRAFTSTTNYNLRDIGPAGGYIFWKSGNDYLEAAPSDFVGVIAWSNVNIVSGNGVLIGDGQSNTIAIINQAGHITSAAKLCDDLVITP